MFWLGVIAVAGSAVYAGHRYDRKHRNVARDRSIHNGSEPVNRARWEAINRGG